MDNNFGEPSSHIKNHLTSAFPTVHTALHIVTHYDALLGYYDIIRRTMRYNEVLRRAMLRSIMTYYEIFRNTMACYEIKCRTMTYCKILRCTIKFCEIPRLTLKECELLRSTMKYYKSGWWTSFSWFSGILGARKGCQGPTKMPIGAINKDRQGHINNSRWGLLQGQMLATTRSHSWPSERADRSIDKKWGPSKRISENTQKCRYWPLQNADRALQKARKH